MIHHDHDTHDYKQFQQSKQIEEKQELQQKCKAFEMKNQQLQNRNAAGETKTSARLRKTGKKAQRSGGQKF